MNARVNTLKSSLHLAVDYGQEAIMRLLLEKGCQVDLPDYFRITALHNAVSRNHQRMVILLLEYGADVDARCCRQETPLHFAAARGV